MGRKRNLKGIKRSLEWRMITTKRSTSDLKIRERSPGSLRKVLQTKPRKDLQDRPSPESPFP